MITGASNPYYRVCSCGCGRPLRKADGTPDWSRRRFFEKTCLAIDKKERVASRRHNKSQRPAAQIEIDGIAVEIQAGALVKALRALGHRAEIVRCKKERA